MSVLATYATKCKEIAEVKNSKEISLGIQEKRVNIIDCKSNSCKKTKSIFSFNLRSVIDGNSLIFVAHIYILVHC